jgi:hypothetical protein
MLKSLGVMGLWALMIAVPHLGSSALQVSVAGVAPVITAPAEDPGDPFREASNPKAPANSEIRGSFATIHLRNELDKTMSLVEVRLTMDGQELPLVTALAPGDDTVVFAGRVAAGHHVFKTELKCRGNSRGPFTYVKKYNLNVASEEVLTVPEERAVVFTIAATRNKGVNVPFEKQVGIAVRANELPKSDSPTN